MIRIHTDEERLCIRAEGHAGAGPKGQDIVCAAVSVLLYAYAAELLRMGTKTEIRDEGDIFEIEPESGGEKEKTAWQTVLTGLRLVAESYENYVTLEVDRFGTYTD